MDGLAIQCQIQREVALKLEKLPEMWPCLLRVLSSRVLTKANNKFLISNLGRGSTFTLCHALLNQNLCSLSLSATLMKPDLIYKINWEFDQQLLRLACLSQWLKSLVPIPLHFDFHRSDFFRNPRSKKSKILISSLLYLASHP